jgi:hypothetical protein
MTIVIVMLWRESERDSEKDVNCGWGIIKCLTIDSIISLHQAHQCYFTMQSRNLTMKMFRINNISRIVDKLCTLKAKGKKKRNMPIVKVCSSVWKNSYMEKGNHDHQTNDQTHKSLSVTYVIKFQVTRNQGAHFGYKCCCNPATLQNIIF